MASKNPKLLVVDLDGTSLGGGHFPYARFPDRLSLFLDSLDACGCRWATNTTWNGEGQRDLIKLSSVKSTPAMIAAELGRRLWTMDGRELSPVSDYNVETEAQLLKALPDIGALFRDLCDSFIPQGAAFHGHFMNFSCLPADEPRFADFLVSIDWKARRLTRYSASASCVAAIPAFLGKGRVLAAMSARLGLKPEDVVVAGDETADIAMMDPKLAKYSLCPSNASDNVKKQVLAVGGVVSEKSCAEGVMDAFRKLAAREGWSLKLDLSAPAVQPA